MALRIDNRHFLEPVTCVQKVHLFHFFSHNTVPGTHADTKQIPGTVRKLRKQDLPTLPHSKLGWEIQAIQMPTCFFKATSRKHVMQVIPTDNAAVRCVETKTF